MDNNIILIGMPGSGKSSVGVVLAKALGYGFVDVDLLIQERTGLCSRRFWTGTGWSGSWTWNGTSSVRWTAPAP